MGYLFKPILIASKALFGECVCPSVSSHQLFPVNGLPLEISYKPSAECTLIELSSAAAAIRRTIGGLEFTSYSVCEEGVKMLSYEPPYFKAITHNTKFEPRYNDNCVLRALQM